MYRSNFLSFFSRNGLINMSHLFSNILLRFGMKKIITNQKIEKIKKMKSSKLPNIKSFIYLFLWGTTGYHVRQGA